MLHNWGSFSSVSIRKLDKPDEYSLVSNEGELAEGEDDEGEEEFDNDAVVAVDVDVDVDEKEEEEVVAEICGGMLWRAFGEGLSLSCSESLLSPSGVMLSTSSGVTVSLWGGVNCREVAGECIGDAGGEREGEEIGMFC